MNRKAACRQIMEFFIRMVNKYNNLEKYPMRYGSRHRFYHSERHILDKFGDNPGKNISEFAQMTAVTKGAISQVVSKLVKKGAVRRYRASGNHKEVFIELTEKGREIYERHQKVNEGSISHLLREFRKYPDDKIEFLISMFEWFEDYLDLSRKRMESHRQGKH